MGIRWRSRPTRLVSAFLRDRAGAVMVMMAVTAAILVGIGALAVDLGRTTTLNTELQKAADAAALAGAAELNRRTDSMTRAETAARNAFAVNTQTFATDGQGATVQVDGVRFFRAIKPDAVTTNPVAARFIEVRVTQRTVDNWLIRVVGGPATSNTTALAVAGLDEVACSTTPLMMCNPAEPLGNTDLDLPVDIPPGTLIHLRPQGPDASWAPGTFGLLDLPEVPLGASGMAEILATSAPNTSCYSSDGVSVRPGQVNSVRTAINTRFDIYETPFFGGNANRQWQYRPARNVVKGRHKQGNDCNADPPDPTKFRALPLAPCAATGTCLKGVVPVDPLWYAAEMQNYWAVNHDPAPYPYGSAPTRYGMYRDEIDTHGIPDNSATGGERGTPACYQGPAIPAGDIDRRLIDVAIVNCEAATAAGLLGGNADNVPVEAIARVFLIRPTVSAADPSVWVEMIQVVSSGSNGTLNPGLFYNVVQLYR